MLASPPGPSYSRSLLSLLNALPMVFLVPALFPSNAGELSTTLDLTIECNTYTNSALITTTSTIPLIQPRIQVILRIIILYFASIYVEIYFCM